MRWATIILLCLAGCNSTDSNQADPIKREAADPSLFPSPAQVTPPTFAWRERPAIAPITPSHFQCKGQGQDPADCSGTHEHGLPFIRGQERVYPTLVQILNYIQEKTHRKVIVTSGHRCPKHNSFADPTSYNETSKHQIGAEVDFYVEGMQASEIIPYIFAYYEDQPEKLASFRRYDRAETNVSTLPWYNQEVFIKLYLPSEGRDKDNTHNKSYLSIQVRWDKELGERVVYTWKKARQYARR